MQKIGELFKEQYGLNALESTNVFMMFGVTAYKKDSKDLVLLVDEISVKTAESLKQDLKEIVDAIKENVGQTLNLVMLSVKSRNAKKELLMEAALLAGFFVHSVTDEKIVFRKEV